VRVRVRGRARVRVRVRVMVRVRVSPNPNPNQVLAANLVTNQHMLEAMHRLGGMARHEKRTLTLTLSLTLAAWLVMRSEP
jgi:hypothetical protein